MDGGELEKLSQIKKMATNERWQKINKLWVIIIGKLSIVDKHSYISILFCTFYQCSNGEN